MQDTTQTHVMETVLFKLKDGVTTDAFLKAAAASVTYVESCSGFISRRLSGAAGTQWVETIEWASLADAEAASAGLAAAEGIGDFLAAVDETSVAMHHTPVQLSLR